MIAVNNSMTPSAGLELATPWLPGLTELFAALLQRSAGGEVQVEKAEALPENVSRTEKAEDQNAIPTKQEKKDEPEQSGMIEGLMAAMGTVPIQEMEGMESGQEGKGTANAHRIGSEPAAPGTQNDSKGGNKVQGPMADKAKGEPADSAPLEMLDATPATGGQLDIEVQDPEPIMAGRKISALLARSDVAALPSPSASVPPASNPPVNFAATNGLHWGREQSAVEPSKQSDKLKKQWGDAVVVEQQSSASELVKTTVPAAEVQPDMEVHAVVKSPPPDTSVQPAMTTEVAEYKAVSRLAFHADRMVERLAGPEVNFTIRASESNNVHVAAIVHDRMVELGVTTSRPETASALRSEVPFLESHLRDHLMELREFKVVVQDASGITSGYSGDQRPKQEWQRPRVPAVPERDTRDSGLEEELAPFVAGRAGEQLSLLA
jgi:hypothetical protein